MSDPAAVELLRALAGVTSRLRLRWYVFGAQAASAYGRPRMTADVDVTIDLGPIASDAFVDELRVAGFVTRRGWEQILTESRVLILTHAATGMPLDVVIAGPGLEEEFLSRALVMDLGGVRVPLMSAEDLVAMKILASRPKDLDDVRGILAEQPAIELARSRGVLQTLEELLGRSDLLPVLERLVSER